MNDPTDPNFEDGAHLRSVRQTPTATHREALRRVAECAVDATAGARGASSSVLMLILYATWQIVRVGICAVLVLIEPILRVTLVPLAFLGFVVTVLFGFLIGDPRFPRWGMLAFSVGALLAYWLFLGLMSLFMRLPGDYDRTR